MASTKIEQTLQELGLTPGETKVYLALLKLGKSNVHQLKRETNIHRTTIYDFLEGWMAYAKQADTFKLRRKILSHFEEKMPDVSSKEINKAVKSKMAII